MYDNVVLFIVGWVIVSCVAAGAYALTRRRGMHPMQYDFKWSTPETTDWDEAAEQEVFIP